MPANNMRPSSPEGALPCCPTCGQQIPDDVQAMWDTEAGIFVANGKAVRFSPCQARIFDALWRTRRNGGIPGIARFMSMVYCGDIDGGPESTSSISVQLAHIRPKLARVGYSITSNYGTPRRGFRLVPADKAEVLHG